MTFVSAFSSSVTAASLPQSGVPAHRPENSMEKTGGGCASCGSGSCSGCGPKAAAKSNNPQDLSDSDRKLVEKLKARDQEVRAHEQAHKAAGGQYAGAISYTYQKGPDGRQYAVGGEVPIDASEIAGDPEATIEKMRQVKAAALAPAEPSAQDRKVAAMADANMQKARAELNARRGGENDPARSGETLSGSLSQQLAELRRQSDPSEPEASASLPSDLTAYAANAYRHQTSPGAGMTA